MSLLHTVGATLRSLVTVPEAEADPSFQRVLERQTRRGMVVTAALGLVGVGLFVGVHLVSGSTPVWVHRAADMESISLADKTFIVAMCLILLAAARAEGVRRWGRPLLAAVMVASGLAMALDDVARGDFSFTVAWLVLVQLVAVGTVPYPPRQALGISLSMLAVYVLTLSLRPDGLSPDLREHRLAYFLLATVVVVTLSKYLYTARYGQHRALQEVEKLRDTLARRSDDLEQSVADLRAAQAQLVRQEKLAALGHVTAGVAHEIQNPLNFVINFAALSRDLVADLRDILATHATRPDADPLSLAEEALDDLRRNATSINDHGQKVARIVSRMMEHARSVPGSLATVDVNAFVRDHVRSARDRLRERLGERAVEGPAGVVVECDLADGVGDAVLDPREMGAVLHNVVDNAFRAALDPSAAAAETSPCVWVATRGHEAAVEIRVADNGHGIPEAARDRLFEPFFTTRPPGEGAGLGLSLAYDAVTHGHGGTLTTEARPGGGTTFVIRLPRAGPRAAADGEAELESDVDADASVSENLAAAGRRSPSAPYRRSEP